MSAALVAAAVMFWTSTSRAIEPSPEAERIAVPTFPKGNNYLPVAIIGDSYTAAPSGYATQIARLMCWRLANLGQGGTGYTNPGQAAENDTVFAGRVQQAVDAAPRLVVVQGGTNDDGKPTTEDAARETFASLRVGLPGVPVVAVGPVRTVSQDPARSDASRDAIQRAAAAEGVPFIDPIALGWLAEPGSFVSDGVHPTSAGHKRYAESLAGQLQALNLPGVQRC